MYLTDDQLANFLRKINYDGRQTEYVDTPCHEWTANAKTYGVFRVGKKSMAAHRVAYMIHHRIELSKDQHILHKCHNCLCVNPDHLKVGTASENMRDMVEAGRNNPNLGSKHGMAKLHENDKPVILQRLAKGEKQKNVANDYGVNRMTIYRLKYNKNWKHV